MVTKTAGTQASGRRLCTAVTRTGDVCGLPLAQDESFCHRHDPGRAEERRKGASTAGKAKPP